MDKELKEVSENKNSSFGVKLSKTIPHKTAIGYKVFYLKDGKLYPPMVQNPGGSDTPIGVWIDASASDVASYSKTGRPQIAKGGAGTHTGNGLLAYRPGWHLGTVPIARQFEKTNPENGIKELFPREFVWAECEYACDIDYQKEAIQEGMTKNGAFRHSYAGLKHLPENGSYRYRTNPDPKTEEWIITGAIKVIRILSNEEVDEICRKNGREPQKREKPYEEQKNQKTEQIKIAELEKQKDFLMLSSNNFKSNAKKIFQNSSELKKIALNEKLTKDLNIKQLKTIIDNTTNLAKAINKNINKNTNSIKKGR